MLYKCNFVSASFLHPITDADSMQGYAVQMFKSGIINCYTMPLIAGLVPLS